MLLRSSTKNRSTFTIVFDWFLLCTHGENTCCFFHHDEPSEYGKCHSNVRRFCLLFIFLSLSLYIYIYIYIYLSIYLSISTYLHPSACMYVCMYVCQHIFLSFYLFYLSLRPSIYISSSVFVCACVCAWQKITLSSFYWYGACLPLFPVSRRPGPHNDFLIRDVWASNLEEEFAIIRDMVEDYPFVSMVIIVFSWWG